MYNTSLMMDGFPSYIKKGKESDESCSESVRVEYDSRSSSHEDFDEYPQLKNGNMIKATERQRQLLRERSNARITNIRVPDTYFEQIGSILKRSLYLSNAEKCEESANDVPERNRSPINYENDPDDEFFLGIETSRSPSPRDASKFIASYERKATADNYLYTREDLPEQIEDCQETKRDVLSEDTLDEIRSFVDQYNEQEQCSRKGSPSNDTEYYETENPISKHRTDSEMKTEKHKRISKQPLVSCVDRSLPDARKPSKSLRSTAVNSNRKSETSVSLGQKKQKSKLRDASGSKHFPECENVFHWETQKKGKKHRIRTSKIPDEPTQSKKHDSDSRVIRSSDSDRTIVEDRKSEASGKAGSSPDRKPAPLAAAHTASRHFAPNVKQRTNKQPQQRTYKSQFVSSEDLSQAEADFGTTDAYLTEDRSTSDVTEKLRKRRSAATSHVPMNSLMRSEVRGRRSETKLAEKNLDNAAFERRKVKKGKRLIAGGPTNSLLRAETRAKAKARSEYFAKSIANGPERNKPGGEKDSQNAVPMFLWSVDSRVQAKKKTTKKHRAAKVAVDYSEGRYPTHTQDRRVKRHGHGMGESEPELGELMDPRAAGDACHDSDSSSKSPDVTLEHEYAVPERNYHHGDDADERKPQESPRYQPTHFRSAKNITRQGSSGNPRGLPRNVIKQTPLTATKKPFR